MIGKIWKISVLVIITPTETSSSSSSSSSSLYRLFFRIEKNHPGIVFVGIKFTISFVWLLEIPQ
jgi:hypothetical protein